ncbi:efflux RND transporter periplasmic adaptor subunit [Thiolapillus brandeum]|nr:efflux RND transporter periplasmic adaptor subunit [Thiolapillus brandeum]
MKKLLPAVLVLLIAGAAFAWFKLRPGETATDALTLYGNVDIREARLTFNASEHVDRILVEEGEHVNKDQLLATLHQELFRSRVAQAQAQVEARRQQLAKLKAGSRPEEIDKAKAEVAAARARARAAHDTWQRLQRLVAKKLASREEVETANSNANAAQAQVEAAQAALQLLQAGPRREDIAAAEADLRAAEANLDLARQNLDNTELHAPADGIIRTRILEPGDMASPLKPALTLAFANPVWVRTYLPETLLGKVKPGMRATIATDSYPNKTYSAWVGYVSPTAEFTPKNVETPELRTRLVYQMRVFACNGNEELRLGMPATVYIDLQAPVTAIPDCQKP